jgi:hypothetical protein
MAEGEGFEPPGTQRPLRLSSWGGRRSRLTGDDPPSSDLRNHRPGGTVDVRSRPRVKVSTEVSKPAKTLVEVRAAPLGGRFGSRW